MDQNGIQNQKERRKTCEREKNNSNLDKRISIMCDAFFLPLALFLYRLPLDCQMSEQNADSCKITILNFDWNSHSHTLNGKEKEIGESIIEENWNEINAQKNVIYIVGFVFIKELSLSISLPLPVNGCLPLIRAKMFCRCC